MSKLRVITLIPLLMVAVLSACTSSSDISIESAALSDISVEDASAAIVKAQEITDAVDATIQATKISGAVDATVEAMAVAPIETATPTLDPTPSPPDSWPPPLCCYYLCPRFLASDSCHLLLATAFCATGSRPPPLARIRISLFVN